MPAGPFEWKRLSHQTTTPLYTGQYFSQLPSSKAWPLAHWNPTQLASGHPWPAVVKVVTIALGLMLETFGTAEVLPDIAASGNSSCSDGLPGFPTERLSSRGWAAVIGPVLRADRDEPL